MDVLVYKGKKGIVNNIESIADIIEVLKLVLSRDKSGEERRLTK